MGPIKRLRLLTTPPCSECENCGEIRYGVTPSCYSETYLLHEEHISGIKYERADNTLVRGTRWCRFEHRSDDDA